MFDVEARWRLHPQVALRAAGADGSPQYVEALDVLADSHMLVRAS